MGVCARQLPLGINGRAGSVVRVHAEPRRIHPQTHPANFQGILQADAYADYDKVIANGKVQEDLKLSCGTTLGMRQRERGDVNCSYDKDEKDPYTCHFGIDLRKGKSMGGATC